MRRLRLHSPQSINQLEQYFFIRGSLPTLFGRVKIELYPYQVLRYSRKFSVIKINWNYTSSFHPRGKMLSFKRRPYLLTMIFI